MYRHVIREEVVRILQIAKEYYPTKNFPMPRVMFSNKMTRCAGRCSYRNGSYTLTFSLPIMEMNNMQDFINRTVYHEIAHMVQHVAYAKMDHKDTFYFVMRNVFMRSAKESTRCHNFDRPERRKNKKKVYIYKCSHCGKHMHISAQRHGKIKKGAEYMHTGCPVVISYTGQFIEK